ncbi:family 43 glycosylhydrolase [Mangrovibacterium diazotrophicum]|uniref:Glycosyl hydrolase family 43 n=1 Tax=Mangrovibacterium diazotrophicum TaxID=1261403 RepID=A0A419W608_9BACT|nr:family 43 glycosylhydrolase [Mangrovibacterium diazotrophicum]RKD90901.1 glycosyl hydrolase family 43 [Mangrovibacterium diazotrophicum]
MDKSKTGLITAITKCFLVFAGLISFVSCKTQPLQTDAYLFVYFTGNGPGEEAIRYAVSTDGYNYRALNDNQPVLDSKKISTSGGVRDPHILRGADDKTFYMVATDLYVPEQGWNNFAMILMKSTDLINWETSVINIPNTYPDQFADVDRVWAPQTIYDEVTGKYMVYFSMKDKGNHPDIIYYAYANKDFTGLEEAPKQLYFPPVESNTKACIDGDIIPYEGKFYLFHKAEDGDPGIKLAISDKLTEGYQLVSDKRVDSQTVPVEGSGIFKLNNTNEYILMYDMYTSGRYQFTKSADLQHFSVIDEEISMNFHPRHGTVLPITTEEYNRLMTTYGKADDLFIAATSDQLKKNNVAINGEKKTIHLPVKVGTDLTAFDPMITAWKGITVAPEGPQDFSKGPVEYTFTIVGQDPVTYLLTAAEDHNPALVGFYADPQVLYSQKTGKYYIYPTSDGFTGWSGYYFKVFSSDDLVNWKDEGKILDMKAGDVPWADGSSWAPTIVEKKVGDDYKYYYYFSGNYVAGGGKQIGVAVADNPTGPFVAEKEPMITESPVGWGQQIDPCAFIDPASGKSYIYWGNGYLAAAELNDDMISIKPKTIKVLTPDGGTLEDYAFREGVYVIYREGTYYFMWSVDDTGSANYHVAYGTSKSPMGPIKVAEKPIVLIQDAANGIYGTGHHSVVKVPGKDEWYIVYHRINNKHLSDGPGYHREVCIDKMEFNADGTIKQVSPTVKGISPVE